MEFTRKNGVVYLGTKEGDTRVLQIVAESGDLIPVDPAELSQPDSGQIN